MILAADPGSEKTGMAVVEEDGSLVIKKVIRTKEFEKEAEDLLQVTPFPPSSWETGRIIRKSRRGQTLSLKDGTSLPHDPCR